MEKKKIKNEGQLPQYYAEETHDAIIDADTFEEAQMVMAAKAKSCQHYAYHTTTMFTSYIRCEKCGCNYRRGKQNNRHFWNCGTFLSKGKQYCQEPRIPETTLYQLTAEVLGDTNFTESDLLENVVDIAARDHTLKYTMQSGEQVIKEWKTPSRASSWTPEMKELARQRAILQWRK